MKKLVRSRRSRMVAGVCGGIADYFNVDPAIVRVAYVLLSLMTAAFPGIFVYLILSLIIPNEY